MTVSSYNYAIFSEFVYGENYVSIPSGGSIYGTSGSSENGYFGQAYINNSTGEVVIAHRGTELSSIGDLQSDLQLANDQVPDQYTEDAKLFIAQVKAQMTWDSLNLNNLTYTPKSLTNESKNV